MNLTKIKFLIQNLKTHFILEQLKHKAANGKL